jgi:CheY-like chemotaxis protein
MPEGGRLTLETAEVVMDEAYLWSHPPARSGRYVMLAVSDNGVGMDEQTKAQLFEPFFTTKEPGKGTGLGLATVYGIVRQSGGFIWVYSEPGSGAAFKIYLPRTDEALPAPENGAHEISLVGNETVLVAEDADPVRHLVRETLERHGYKVLEARDGRSALEIAASHAGAIDVLLTDIVMPQLGGRELAAQLRRERAGIRVLFMSGYTDDTVIHHDVLESGSAYLQKPFTPDGLARKVREVLNAPEVRPP